MEETIDREQAVVIDALWGEVRIRVSNNQVFLCEATEMFFNVAITATGLNIVTRMPSLRVFNQTDGFVRWCSEPRQGGVTQAGQPCLNGYGCPDTLTQCQRLIETHDLRRRQSGVGNVEVNITIDRR
ncbi:hypothetical protein D3C87_1584320 [compost metagenome]